MNVVILYGTETGNTEMLTEDLAADLRGAHAVRVLGMQDASPEVFGEDALFLVVTSTYGDGELPAAAQPFHDALAAARPDLGGVRFGVFGLGDRQYGDTFGFGSRHMEDLLVSLGATRVGRRQVHDASGPEMVEDHAREWLAEVMAAAEA